MTTNFNWNTFIIWGKDGLNNLGLRMFWGHFSPKNWSFRNQPAGRSSKIDRKHYSLVTSLVWPLIWRKNLDISVNIVIVFLTTFPHSVILIFIRKLERVMSQISIVHFKLMFSNMDQYQYSESKALNHKKFHKFKIHSDNFWFS